MHLYEKILNYTCNFKKEMKNLDLLVNRQICLYLNAKDKLKFMAKVSKSWRKLVYSGYAWESLFD